jgi:nitrate/nitrite transporter NarK
MDQPNALSSYIEKGLTGDSPTKYNMLYAFYSYPNIILPFFSGILIDKIGLKISSNLLFFCAIIGQILFVAGGYYGQGFGFWMAIAGRTIFGVGNESLWIVQNVFANKWFRGKELAFAMAISMSVGRLGSTSNDFLMPVIASAAGLGTALLFGLILILISYIILLVLLWIEDKAEKNEPHLERNENNETVDFSYVKRFPTSFWIITISWVSIYTSIFAFNNISNDFFMESYGFNLKVAARITSIIFIIAALFWSVFGFITDRIGYRVTQVIFASCMITLSHLMFLMMPNCHRCYEGVLPMVLLGVAYSIYAAALWPMIPIVIKEEYLGTAFGILLAIQNAGLGFGPNVVGLLQGMSGGYEPVMIFFLMFSFIGIISGFILYILNKRYHENSLQLSSQEILRIQNRHENHYLPE